MLLVVVEHRAVVVVMKDMVAAVAAVEQLTLVDTL
tara:strand:+ start:191 stop:295 length:105 start_codon:yes stop_codon:yes gene_type:complete